MIDEKLPEPRVTSDLEMAAFFCTLGHSVMGCVPVGSNPKGDPIMGFVFADWDDADKDIEQWITGHGKAADHKRYARHLRYCKKLLKNPVS